MYDTIMQKYQSRKTRAQKDAFIEMLQARYPALRVEKNGLFKSRNLVYGDPETADIVFTAHYDTVSTSFLPNLVTPDRPYIRYLNTILIIAPMVVLMLAARFAAERLGASEIWQRIIMLTVYFAAFFAFFFGGSPSKTTANDNTSGVLTLCRLMDTLPAEQLSRAAFIFFDNEEYGCIGSAAYKKAHKQTMKEKLVFNMDCVGDGDTILIVLSKKAMPEYEQKFRAAFPENERFKLRIASAKKVNYSSDQKNFPISAAAAAMKTSKWLGLYMDRIHTKKDTVCARENIEYISACAAELMKSI